MQVQDWRPAVLNMSARPPLHEVLAGAARGTGNMLETVLTSVMRPFMKRQLC